MHIPSMMLDVQKGQPIEVEVIIGEVVRMAKSVGVEIPVSNKPDSSLWMKLDPWLNELIHSA